MKHLVKIEPSISPKARRIIERAIESIGYEVIGAGQSTDGSFSSISFERDDVRDEEKIDKGEDG